MLEDVPNIYSIDALFVMQTTKRDANMWDTIPEEVLKTADVPDVLEENCLYA